MFYLSYQKTKALTRGVNNRETSKLYLKAKNAERNLLLQKYHFYNINDMLIWANDWVRSFPETYDLIVGVPRSGLLIANIVALRLGKPLTTPEGFIKGDWWASKHIKSPKEIKKVLLVEDYVYSGKSLNETMEILNSKSGEYVITKASLVVTERTADMVDLYCRVIPTPAIFEWNLMHYKLGTVATDMDGVLCEDCPLDSDTDDESYCEWLKNAKPYMIPSFSIDSIVTNRLEKYRPETEEWLRKHEIRYSRLIMWDLPSMSDRKGKYAEHKIDELLKIRPDYFIESNPNEARQIWKETSIPTICTDDMELLC